MLKVLIVDDEWIIRDGLKSFPWEDLGCAVVGEAEDGEEGLLLSRTLAPDIILSDIKMPGMDGLDFARRAKEIHPQVKIILLTGYDSFEYAQDAIRTGVYEYLLKPTNLEELRRVIRRLTGEIHSQNRQSAQHRELKEKYRKAMPILMGKLAGDLLGGKLVGSQAENKLAQFGIRVEKYLVLAGSAGGRPAFDDGPLEPWLLEFGISNIMEEVLRGYTSTVLLDADGTRFHSILLFPASSTDRDCREVCAQACARMQRAVKDYVGMTMSFGISEVGREIRQVEAHCQQALNACRQCAFLGSDSIVYHSDLPPVRPAIWKIPAGEKQTLFDAISLGNNQAVEEFCQRLPAKLAETDCQAAVRSELLELVLHCLRLYEEVQALDRQAALETIHQCLESIYSSESGEEMTESLRQVLLLFAGRNSQVQQDYHLQTVDRIRAYLLDHYRENLSLELVAEEFRLSGSYVSRLIKKHTHKNFVEILSEIRLEKAKELIEAGRHKIYEVAELVGYNDYSYFISVFRKRYGVTPNQYKKFL